MITEEYVREILDKIREKLEHAKEMERIRAINDDDFCKGFYAGVEDTCEDILRQFEEM